MIVESPLIEIIDDFARDQDELEDDQNVDEYDEEDSESDKSSEKMTPTKFGAAQAFKNNTTCGRCGKKIFVPKYRLKRLDSFMLRM